MLGIKRKNDGVLQRIGNARSGRNTGSRCSEGSGREVNIGNDLFDASLCCILFSAR